jgi:TolA-binding protein
MKEAMYAFRLKRQLMHIYNVMGRLQDAADKGDVEATKILRFYQLGLEQMHKLDNNSYELMELEGQMRELESKMKEMGIEQNQTEFDVKLVDDYRK